MTRSVLLCLLLFALLTACKKEKKVVTYSVVGTWSLYSYQTNFGGGIDASVVQYPCLLYNTLTFFRDSTSSESYSGADTCFITPNRGPSAQRYGVPGFNPLHSTWSQNGNNVRLMYPGNPQPVPGVVASTNGRLQITFKDTVKSGGNTYYITTIEVKD